MKCWQLTALVTAILFVVIVIIALTATVPVVDDLLVNAGILVAPFLFALAVLILVGAPILPLPSLAIVARQAAIGRSLFGCCRCQDGQSRNRSKDVDLHGGKCRERYLFEKDTSLRKILFDIPLVREKGDDNEREGCVRCRSMRSKRCKERSGAENCCHQSRLEIDFKLMPWLALIPHLLTSSSFYEEVRERCSRKLHVRERSKDPTHMHTYTRPSHDTSESARCVASPLARTVRRPLVYRLWCLELFL